MHRLCKNALGTQLIVPAAPSRRKGPFRAAIGPGPCRERRWMEATLGQQEPLEHIASSRRQRISCPGRGSLTAACCVGRICPPGPLRRDWGGARGDRRVAGRVRARVDSKSFTLTKLTSWADGLWVEGRGVAAACHQDYFWANRGLGSVREVRRHTKALFDRAGQFRHHGPHSD